MEKPSHLKPKCPMLIMAALTGLLAAANLANSQTWTPTSAPTQEWQAIASSADGLKLAAAGYSAYYLGDGDFAVLPSPILLSTDSGATWKQTPAPSGYWRSVACSADGTKLVAADGGVGLPDYLHFYGIPQPRGYGSIYVSTNSGDTWTTTTAPSNSWNSVASSADGTKLIAAAYATHDFNDVIMIGTLIYTSADSGLNWAASPLPSNSWSCVASSADGARLVAAAYATHDTNSTKIGNLIYTSTNSGASWTPAGVSSNSWSSVASSADGTRLVATSGSASVHWPSGDGLIYTSTNSGTTWTASSAPSNNWASVVSSADGTKLVAAAHEAYNGLDLIFNLIYSSTNSGVTWTQEDAPSNSWTSVACSSDGARISAAGDRLYISSYLGPWKLAGAPTEPWLSVASSADGTKLASVSDQTGPDHPGFVCISTDSGATWVRSSAPTNGWNAAAISSDGARIVAVASVWHGGSIYTSLDSGATWTQTGAPNNEWSSVASSADGTKLVAASFYDSLIYTSPDSGVTWKHANPPLENYTSIASSANGSKLAAAGGPFIYSSKDSGVHWTYTNSLTNYDNFWLSIASSADGTKLVGSTAADNNSPDRLIYVSSDSGTTWTETTAPGNYWSCVSCSADGTVLAACAGNLIGPAIFRWTGAGGFEGIYLSTNSGIAWEDTRAPGEAWSSVAISADGKRLVAVSRKDSHIYTLQLPFPPPPPFPSLHLDVNASAGHIGISWLVPSTSFGLQQNDDLTTTNWTDVSITPSLNFSNLHNEVTALPSPGCHFYRLRSP